MSDLQALNDLDVPWSAGLVLVAAGTVLMLFGSRWRDFTEALSTSFLGGVAALLAMPALGVNPVWPAAAVCLLTGLGTILFRRIALVVLAAVVLGLALSVTANLLMGWPTIPLLVRSLSSEHVGTIVRVPDYVRSQLLFGLLTGGMLLGVILAIAVPTSARRVVMALEGSLAFLGGIALITGEFFSAQLPRGYPMKYSQVAAVVWLELAVVSILMQRLADRRAAPEATAGRDAETEHDAGGPGG